MDAQHIPAIGGPKEKHFVRFVDGRSVLMGPGNTVLHDYGDTPEGARAAVVEMKRLNYGSLVAGADSVGFPHPDADDASDAVAALINDWCPPSMRSDPGETRERLARCNDQHCSLRGRMRDAATRMTSSVEPDGTVKLPRTAAHFLAALMNHLADEIPADTYDFDAAFARGWLDCE
jgi:hypothetical protein